MPEPTIRPVHELRTLLRHEQIADYYASLIDEGRIQPGYQLPSVESIRTTWKVGRTTAHDAIRELERRGLVDIKPKHGTFARVAS